MTGILSIEDMKVAMAALRTETFIVQDLLRTASINLLIEWERLLSVGRV